MSSMRGVFFLEPGKLELREVTIPEPGPGEVVIKIEAATTCGTDLKGYKRGHRLFRPPMPFGHEYAGVVTAVGAGVKQFREGDAVCGANSAPCNTCFFCRRGQQSLCIGIEDSFNFGSYADYFRIPAHIVAQNLHHKPENVSFAHAGFVEPLACAVNGVINADIQFGDTVAIIGPGAQGLMQMQVARSVGAARVIMIGRARGRLEVARALGADAIFSSQDGDPVEFVKSLTDGRGADVVIESAGASETWSQALLMVRKGGTIVQYSGLPGGTQVSFDATHLHYGGVTMKGVFHLIPRTVEMAVQALASGAVDVAPLLEGSIPLEQVEDGLLRMARSEVIKLAVEPGLTG
ncbi:MAG: zinc-binding dehydrogenase [Anaerolineae bacterium]|nr:zinc-binding dehydrogenase [Anaerolineae bacterium]